MGAHCVSIRAPASMCTAQHYQRLFRQSQLINRRAEMHLNWFIWLALDVIFYSTGDNLFISVRALNLCACSCVCLCVLADRCSSSQTVKIPPQQVNLGEANTCAQKNRFFIPDGSIVFCSGEISWEHSAGHSFEPLQLALYIYSSIRIKMNARKKKEKWRQSRCHGAAVQRGKVKSG